MTTIKIIYLTGEERIIENVVSWTLTPKAGLIIDTLIGTKNGDELETYHLNNDKISLFYEVK